MNKWYNKYVVIRAGMRPSGFYESVEDDWLTENREAERIVFCMEAVNRIQEKLQNYLCLLSYFSFSLHILPL
jgi:hypothetical protein